MNVSKNGEQTGGLVISEDVVATIACTASKDIPGVAGFASRPADIKGILTRRAAGSKSVKVTMSENAMIIDIYINIESGFKIPAVAENVQACVKEEVQNMTGRLVEKVNVIVAGIDLIEK